MALQTQIGNFIIRGVDSLIVKDYETQNAIDIVKHLKTAGLENTGEVVSVTGDKGNRKIHTYTGSKASKITFTNATNNLNFLKMQTGSEIVEGSKDVEITEVHKITSNKITLTKTIKGDPIGVFVDGKKFTKAGSSATSSTYTISGQDITFEASQTGTVTTAFYSTITNAQTIQQNSDSESATVSLAATLLLQDVKTKKGYLGVLSAKSAKLEENFNLNASQDGEPEPISLPFDLNEVDGEPTWELTVFAN